MKLNPEQKRELKALKEWFKGLPYNLNPRFYQDEFVTVYMVDEFPGSRMSRAGWSIVSPGDTFKKSTGKYFSLLRLYDSPALFPSDIDPDSLAEFLASSLPYSPKWMLTSGVCRV